MHKLVILIEAPEDQAKLEADWPKFLRLAEQMPGLRREVTSRVSEVAFGTYPCVLIHELIFDNPEAAYQALNTPVGQAAGEALQALTRGRMTLLFADHMEDSLDHIRRAGKAGPEGDDAQA